MKWWQYLTLAGGAILSAAPTFIPLVPGNWAPIATAFLSLANGAVHLYMVPPKS